MIEAAEVDLWEEFVFGSDYNTHGSLLQCVDFILDYVI